MANTLAYYIVILMTALKGFIVETFDVF
jgi:hypothetical protein